MLLRDFAHQRTRLGPSEFVRGRDGPVLFRSRRRCRSRGSCNRSRRRLQQEQVRGGRSWRLEVQEQVVAGAASTGAGFSSAGFAAGAAAPA